MKDQHPTAGPLAPRRHVVGADGGDRPRCDREAELRVLLLNARCHAKPMPAASLAHGLLGCGTHVVAAFMPGLEGSVPDGVTGPLVRLARPAAVSAAITKLLADPEARRRMSRRALAWSANFDWEESASAVLRAIRRAVGRGSTRSVARIHAPTDAGRSMASLPVAAAGRGGSP